MTEYKIDPEHLIDLKITAICKCGKTYEVPVDNFNMAVYLKDIEEVKGWTYPPPYLQALKGLHNHQLENEHD